MATTQIIPENMRVARLEIFTDLLENNTRKTSVNTEAYVMNSWSGTISVKNDTTGETIELDVNSSDTIEYVKQKIKDKYSGKC